MKVFLKKEISFHTIYRFGSRWSNPIRPLWRSFRYRNLCPDLGDTMAEPDRSTQLLGLIESGQCRQSLYSSTDCKTDDWRFDWPATFSFPSGLRWIHREPSQRSDQPRQCEIASLLFYNFIINLLIVISIEMCLTLLYVMQWAAVKTHFLWMRAPPQNRSPRNPTNDTIL